MTFTPRRVAVVGATGPTGWHLCRELAGRGVAVRAISRSRDHLEREFAGLDAELAAADALDPEALSRALDGCDLAIDSIGLPPERMADHPATARNLAGAAGAGGLRHLEAARPARRGRADADDGGDRGNPRLAGGALRSRVIRWPRWERAFEVSGGR